jgi:hypothetical protein
LTLNTGQQANVITVASTAVGTSTTVNAGPGGDQVNVTPQTQDLDALASPLTVNGAGAKTSLVINDQANPYSALGSNQYEIDNNVVLRTRFTTTLFGLPFVAKIPMYYSNVANLTLNAGQQANVITVRSSADGTSSIINAGAGGDTVNIGSATNTLDPILGPVSVYGQANTTLNVYDQGTSSQQAYAVSATQITRTPANAPASPTQTINYFNMASVNLYGGSAADGWNVYSSSAGTTTALYSSGGGISNANEFVVHDSAGTLDSIQGPLALHGGGTYDFAIPYDAVNTIGHTLHPDHRQTPARRHGRSDLRWHRRGRPLYR